MDAADGPPWVTAGDLAEYAFCPRAHFYAASDVVGTPDARTEAGRLFHGRTLGSVRTLHERRGGYAAGLLLALLGAAIVLFLLFRGV